LLSWYTDACCDREAGIELPELHVEVAISYTSIALVEVGVAPPNTNSCVFDVTEDKPYLAVGMLGKSVQAFVVVS
jgi:hypothetical protein